MEQYTTIYEFINQYLTYDQRLAYMKLMYKVDGAPFNRSTWDDVKNRPIVRHTTERNVMLCECISKVTNKEFSIMDLLNGDPDNKLMPTAA